MSRRHSPPIAWVVLAACFGWSAALFSGCDATSGDADALVVELYLQPDRVLPPLRLTRAIPLGSPVEPVAETGAMVTIDLNGRAVNYQEQMPGTYRPIVETSVQAGDAFRLRVASRDGFVTASGRVPPAIHIDSVRVRVPSVPIEAVLLDSLILRLDSLALSIPSRTGFIYPIDVQVWWKPAPSTLQDYWIETSLDPLTAFSSSLVDFFLLPSTVLEEPTNRPQASWTGVYAVAVARKEDPVPEHTVRVSLVRGTIDFARFALSRHDPDRREPVGNVEGGIGIATGVALDTLRVLVR